MRTKRLREEALARATAHFEELYARMQTAECRAGVTRALAATPEEMGRAAVAALEATRRSHYGDAVDTPIRRDVVVVCRRRAPDEPPPST